MTCRRISEVNPESTGSMRSLKTVSRSPKLNRFFPRLRFRRLSIYDFFRFISSRCLNELRPSVIAVNFFSGPWVNSSIMDSIGKKPTMLFSNALFLSSWILLAYNPNFYIMLVGRSIGGLAFGLTTNIVPLYITDVTDVTFIFNLH